VGAHPRPHRLVLGQTPLNILVLGVIYKGTAFPLLWAILEKKGCSNTMERCALLDEFGRLFGFSSIAYLCGDREFIGKKWFSYLRRILCNQLCEAERVAFRRVIKLLSCT
jgi:hypothetical protein